MIFVPSSSHLSRAVQVVVRRKERGGRACGRAGRLDAIDAPASLAVVVTSFHVGTGNEEAGGRYLFEEAALAAVARRRRLEAAAFGVGERGVVAGASSGFGPQQPRGSTSSLQQQRPIREWTMTSGAVKNMLATRANTAARKCWPHLHWHGAGTETPALASTRAWSCVSARWPEDLLHHRLLGADLPAEEDHADERAEEDEGITGHMPWWWGIARPHRRPKRRPPCTRLALRSARAGICAAAEAERRVAGRAGASSVGSAARTSMSSVARRRTGATSPSSAGSSSISVPCGVQSRMKSSEQ